MNKQFNDDDITQLYMQSNDEMPPKTLDDAILAHAAAAVEAQSSPGVVNKNRRWQYSGVAAAIFAVAVFAPWQYYQAPEIVPAEPVIAESLTTQLVQNSTKPQAQKVLESASPVEASEVLADDLQPEQFVVTGARIKHEESEHEFALSETKKGQGSEPAVDAIDELTEENILVAKSNVVEKASEQLAAIPQTKKVLQSEQAVESIDDGIEFEKIEVTGARVAATPEQQNLPKARKVNAAPAVGYGINDVSKSEFSAVITKFEAQDKTGAEDALIKLLQEQPALHKKVPKSLEALYLALLESGKLTKPEQ